MHIFVCVCPGEKQAGWMLVESEGFRHVPGMNCGGITLGELHGNLMELPEISFPYLSFESCLHYASGSQPWLYIRITWKILFYYFTLFFSFYGHNHGIWMFPGEDVPSHGNTFRALTTEAPWALTFGAVPKESPCSAVTLWEFWVAHLPFAALSADLSPTLNSAHTPLPDIMLAS